MRVLHIITRMIIGGAQENTLFNCLDLVRDFGDEVCLLTGVETGPEGDLLSKGRAGGLQIKYVPNLIRSIHPWKDWQALKDIRRAIGEFQPDVVHTHSAKGGLLGRRAAYLERVPAIVHTVHGAPFHPYQSWPARKLFQSCERAAARWCDKLISVADAMTDLMVEANVTSRDRFVTIYSGMNVEPFLSSRDQRDATRATLGIAPDQIVVGKIARLFKLKGHDDLIDAAASVVAAQPKVRFLFVGDGILRGSLKAKIDQLGLQDHFIFAGLVPPSEVPRLIGAMDMLVHTSYREGLARALPQALISGIPAISYDVDGAREVVIDDQTGYLVPAGGTRMLSQRITQLANSRELCERLGRAGQLRCTEQFRHQSMTRAIRELYLQLLESSPRR